jgi:hypothetical protein
MAQSTDILRRLVNQLADNKIAVPQGALNTLSTDQAIQDAADLLAGTTARQGRKQ